MNAATLELPSQIYQRLQAHLLRQDSLVEQAAFVFANAIRGDDDGIALQYVDWFPVPPEGFIMQHEFHLELADEQRAAVIKRAHDLNASLVEFHSHTGAHPAEFSPSDMAGFSEFVPHVWWRLKRRPYAAVVMASSGVDALVWVEEPTTPQLLAAIVLGNRQIKATGLSLKRLQREGSYYGSF